VSILLNVIRPDGLPDVVYGAVTGGTRLRMVTMHALRCDNCGSEARFARTQEVEVPVGWIATAENKHRCPKCRTRRAVQRDRAEYLRFHRTEVRRLLSERGITDPQYVNLALRMIGS
jgi:hypothetical protein